MRYSFIKTLFEAAAKDRRIMLLTGDLGFTVFEEFAHAYPKQFLNMGVAEQNLVTVSAGLALSGKIPFVYSIATFMSMRPFEQIRNDVCAHNANVKIIGTGGGLSYGHAGLTHHSLEDVGIMRILPNMTVVCPSDPRTVNLTINQAIKKQGPFYIRLGKKGEPDFHKNLKFKIGQGIILSLGKDICLFATGNIVHNTLLAAEELKKIGIKATVVEIHTVKPIDRRLIMNLAKKFTHCLTVEEHHVTGGLGSAVAEVLAESGYPIKLHRLGISDHFQKMVGSHQYLRELNSLSVEGIKNFTQEFLKHA